MKKRLLSMLMAVLMIASLVPATALAAGACTADKQIEDHDVVVVSIDKTATHPGVKAIICNTEKEVVSCTVDPFAEANVINKCNHSWKTEELQKLTCDQIGVTLKYCEKCGTAAPTAYTKKTELKSHDWQFTVEVKPTCKVDGWGYAVCKNCKEIKFIANHGDVEKLLKPAYDKGEIANTVYNNTVAMFEKTNSEHKLADLKAVTEKTTVKDAQGNDVVLVPKTEATHTPTVSGYVYIDGNNVEIMPLNTETYTNYVKKMGANGVRDVDVYAVYNVVTKTGGWHGIGYTGSAICESCGYYVQGNYILGLNRTHTLTLDTRGYYPYVDASGNRHDGVTDKYWCEDCGKYIGGEKLAYDEYVDYTKYAAQGDVRVFGAKEAHCWEAGNTGVKKMYDGVKWVDIDVMNNNKPITVEHKFVLAEGKPATCTEDGYSYDNYYVCANVKPDGTPCPGHKGDDVQKITKAKGHTEAVKVLVAPTCSSDGMSVKYCSVCNAYLTKGDLNGTNDTTPAYYIVKAVPHTAGDPVNAKEATCTEVGYTGDKVCKWCGIMLEKGKEIPIKEHTVVDVAAVEATCTADGMTAGTKCSVCGTVLSGCEVVKALGHDFKDGKCTRCGEKDPNYVPPVVNPFKDVEKSSPYYDAIIWAADKGVTTGKTADTFGINDGCTRAQIVTFLYRAAGSPAVKADTVNPFTDVSKDSVYYNAILWAVEKGITKGTTETTFDPNAVCTRGQIVTFLFRASGDEKVATGIDFADVASGSYCADAVAWAVANKVANGFADGTFRPEATCTRGQAVTFIYRALAE